MQNGEQLQLQRQQTSDPVTALFPPPRALDTTGDVWQSWKTRRQEFELFAKAMYLNQQPKKAQAATFLVFIGEGARKTHTTLILQLTKRIASPQLQPVGAHNDDGESAPKKRAIVRDQPALRPEELDDIKSTLSAIKESLRFLGESMALVQSTLAAHGNRLGQVEHYLDHIVAPAVAAGQPVSQRTTTPSSLPHAALLHPSDHTPSRGETAAPHQK
ncbi:hypothetical protein HPB52_014764 [Rhipicephalus sanguineus]|uniref:Tick transposon n=1 Tax=Rhipicephalus sanguineus TaxID=34632 RepID=A0A9D4SP88_RHISA|nr:hypothetical protein HPB52_014764 [Rhipicephalus sanguineus]